MPVSTAKWTTTRVDYIDIDYIDYKAGKTGKNLYHSESRNAGTLPMSSLVLLIAIAASEFIQMYQQEIKDLWHI